MSCRSMHENTTWVPRFLLLAPGFPKVLGPVPNVLGMGFLFPQKCPSANGCGWKVAS